MAPQAIQCRAEASSTPTPRAGSSLPCTPALCSETGEEKTLQVFPLSHQEGSFCTSLCWDLGTAQQSAQMTCFGNGMLTVRELLFSLLFRELKKKYLSSVLNTTVLSFAVNLKPTIKVFQGLTLLNSKALPIVKCLPLQQQEKLRNRIC